MISSASTHDINLVTEVVDNAVIKRKKRRGRGITRRQHLCLDKGYNSVQEEQEIIKRGYMHHIPIKKKKKSKKSKKTGKKEEEQQEEPRVIPFRKKYSPKRWVVERTNSWHNRFRKLFTRYEKKAENYLGLVQFSCCIIIYRKIILG